MKPSNPFSDFAFGRLFETVLPDFVLAFTFFTALAYAVLGKRFDHQRPAIAMAGTLGLSLAVGLVWWERQANVSIRDLGPIAVGIALLASAGIMFQGVRQTGGLTAGAGIALGVGLLLTWIMGLHRPIPDQVIQSCAAVVIIGGVIAFLIHYKRGGAAVPVLIGRGGKRQQSQPPVLREQAIDLREGQAASEMLNRRFRELEERSRRLYEHPADAGDVMLQLRRMLPAEGWLTERLARVREKVYQVREGNVARIEELRRIFRNLPQEAKKKASEELVASYKELGLDVRMERLDRAVAANEKRIRDLTQKAQVLLAAHDYRRLHDLLKAAQKLQQHNSRLFRIMNRTEARLQAQARKVARAATGVSGA